MNTLNISRIILLLAAIITAWVAYDISQTRITDHITFQTDARIGSNAVTAVSGITNASLGFSIISAMCFLGLSITYINNKQN